MHAEVLVLQEDLETGVKEVDEQFPSAHEDSYHSNSDSDSELITPTGEAQEVHQNVRMKLNVYHGIFRSEEASCDLL